MNVLQENQNFWKILYGHVSDVTKNKHERIKNIIDDFKRAKEKSTKSMLRKARRNRKKESSKTGTPCSRYSEQATENRLPSPRRGSRRGGFVVVPGLSEENPQEADVLTNLNARHSNIQPKSASHFSTPASPGRFAQTVEYHELKRQ